MNTEGYAHILDQARVMATPQSKASYCTRCGGWVKWAALVADPDTLELQALLYCGHGEPAYRLKVVKA